MKMIYNKKVEIEVCENCKYRDLEQERITVQYDIEAFEVKHIDREEILKETDGSCVDDYDEYLILYLKNGDTATFRNSYVDMFPVK